MEVVSNLLQAAVTLLGFGLSGIRYLKRGEILRDRITNELDLFGMGKAPVRKEKGRFSEKGLHLLLLLSGNVPHEGYQCKESPVISCFLLLLF